MKNRKWKQWTTTIKQKPNQTKSNQKAGTPDQKEEQYFSISLEMSAFKIIGGKFQASLFTRKMCS